MNIAQFPEGAVFTVGHSTRALGDFVGLLSAFGIEMVVDVRTIPRSRANPQFNKETLPSVLASFDILYLHLKELGGLRHARKDSLNTGWTNKSFRGYADFMQTDAFRNGVERVVSLARVKRVALMCAEAVPWRCHRSLIGDALIIRGVPVIDILGERSFSAHELTSFAKVEGLKITYPSE